MDLLMLIGEWLTAIQWRHLLGQEPLEIIGTVAGVLGLVLLAQEKRAGWLVGMIWAITSAYLVELGQQTQIVSFPGYLLEVITQGAVPALEHQVNLPADRQQERFSFAFFSIPKPGSQLQFGSLSFSAEQYTQQYLSLYP
ncbi:MAG: hypothetical protein GX324_06210 [Aeromonadales bacterium]|nr:hypothetical protein [Aeromonadales bacterium]